MRPRILLGLVALTSVLSSEPSFGIGAFNDCSTTYTSWQGDLTVLEGSISSNAQKADLESEGVWAMACNADEECQSGVASIQGSLVSAGNYMGNAASILASARTAFLHVLSQAQASGIGAGPVAPAVAANILTLVSTTGGMVDVNYGPAFVNYSGLAGDAINLTYILSQQIPEINVSPLHATADLSVTYQDFSVAQAFGSSYVSCVKSTLATIGSMVVVKIQGLPPAAPGAGPGPRGPAPMTGNPPPYDSTIFFSTTPYFSMPSLTIDYVHQFINEVIVQAGTRWQAFRGMAITTSVPAGVSIGPILDWQGNTAIPAGTPVCAGQSPVGPVGGVPVDPDQLMGYSSIYNCFEINTAHLSLLANINGPGFKACMEAGTNVPLLSGLSTACSFTFETDGPPNGPGSTAYITYYPATTNDVSIHQTINLHFPSDNPPAGSCYAWNPTDNAWEAANIPGCTSGGTGGTGGTGTGSATKL